MLSFVTVSESVRWTPVFVLSVDVRGRENRETHLLTSMCGAVTESSVAAVAVVVVLCGGGCSGGGGGGGACSFVDCMPTQRGMCESWACEVGSDHGPRQLDLKGRS